MAQAKQLSQAIHFPDRFLKALHAHDTDTDATVKIVGGIRRKKTIVGSKMARQRHDHGKPHPLCAGCGTSKPA
jgi:hypothetical protein